MSVVLLPGIGEEHIPVNSLKTLEDAGFEDWIYCTRPLDMDHVEHLIESDPDTWPSLKTVRVQISGQSYHAIVDGRHRTYAAIELQRESIKVHSDYYADEDAVIEAAFDANLRHGLGANNATRSEYAVWLYFRDESDKPNLSAIARKVGLNQSTVSRAVNKALKAQDEEQEEESEYKAEVTNAARLATALHKFFTQERTLRGTLSDGTKQVDVTHRAKMLYRHIASIPKDKQQEAFKELVSLNTSLQAFIEMCTPAKKTGTR